MSTFIAGFVIFMLAFLGLAVGWLFAGKRLKGSCGGINGDGCSVCERPCEERERAMQQRQVQSQA